MHEATFFECDVSDEQQVADTLARAEKTLGKLDIVINNAGLTHLGGTLGEMGADYFQLMQNVNVNGVFHGIKHAPKHMNDGGSIINTASLAAFMKSAGTAAYNASKAAVVSLTKSAAIELGPRGIRVNAVCPGHTMVDLPGLTEEEIVRWVKSVALPQPWTATAKRTIRPRYSTFWLLTRAGISLVRP